MTIPVKFNLISPENFTGEVFLKKTVKSKIPVFFKDASVPSISYTYKHWLEGFNNDDFKSSSLIAPVQIFFDSSKLLLVKMVSYVRPKDQYAKGKRDIKAKNTYITDFILISHKHKK